MDTHMKSPGTLSHRTAEGVSRNAKLALWSAFVVAGFFVLREHWSHALGLLPYLLLIACPLMHLFGHGHHHGSHEHHNDRDHDRSAN
jgi:Protein of unknown function (DUF2933)